MLEGEERRVVVQACPLLIDRKLKLYSITKYIISVGTSVCGGLPGRDSGKSTDGFQLFITAASHRFSNLRERHCSELFQSLVPPAFPKQF